MEKFSPMKLRGIIKSSDLTIDRKREIDEIISSYNEGLFARQSKSMERFGHLIMDIVECEHLFDVIPTEGIPTYDEFMRCESGTQEFSRLVREYEEAVSVWFGKVFKALDFYIVLDSDRTRTELILVLIYIAGVGGQRKYHRNNKLAMICRMLFSIWNKYSGDIEMSLGNFNEITEKSRNKIFEMPENYDEDFDRKLDANESSQVSKNEKTGWQ